MDAFVGLFTDPCTLETLIARACNHAAPYATDPITDVACAMIRAPLEISVSSLGLVMFKDVPNIVLPFGQMRPEQKLCLHELISDPGPDRAVVSRSSCLCVTFPGETKSRRLDVKDVLIAVCSAIMNGSGVGVVSPRTKLALCNLVLQRIGSVVHISHEVFVFLYERMHENFSVEADPDLSGRRADGGSHVGGKPPPLGPEREGSAQGAASGAGKKRALDHLVVED